MARDDEFVEIEGTILRQTGNAIHFDDGNITAWIPKSQIQETDFSTEKDELVEITIPEWLAFEKGLI